MSRIILINSTDSSVAFNYCRQGRRLCYVCLCAW